MNFLLTFYLFILQFPQDKDSFLCMLLLFPDDACKKTADGNSLKIKILLDIRYGMRYNKNVKLCAHE